MIRPGLIARLMRALRTSQNQNNFSGAQILHSKKEKKHQIYKFTVEQVEQWEKL